MIPKRVVLENFLSHGDPATEFAFDGDEPLWVLCGPNGVGKSAVFDGITYALFAEHRGGATDHACLIRHGANTFRVVFEFEFDKADYRITRTRPRNGRPTQRVERRVPDGSWLAVDLTPAAGRQDPVRAWAERLLGMGFDQFTKSVLLRQGEADEIVTAKGTERLTLLKKIIGADRFERLSDRVHGETRGCKDRLGDLQTKKDGMTPVTAEELQAAGTKRDEADTTSAAAHQQRDAAVERVGQARHWVGLEEQRRRLDEQIHKADERGVAAEQIRNDKARLDELTAVVPVLRQSVALRERLSYTAKKLGGHREGLTRLTAERDALVAAVDQERQKGEAHGATAVEHAGHARRLREEIIRETAFVSAATAVAALRTELTSYPADLVDRLTAARKAIGTATAAATAAATEKAEAVGLLKQARIQQTKFAAVGATCSLCGQSVTAEHAETERNRLAALIENLNDKVAGAGATEEKAGGEKSAAEIDRDRLDEQARLQSLAAERLGEKERTLAELGVTADADTLRAALRDKHTRADGLESSAAQALSDQTAAETEAIRLDGSCKAAGQQMETLEKAIRKAELEVAIDEATAAGLIAQLSADWQARLDTLDLDAVNVLEEKRQALATAGIADQFRQLEQDAARRAEWVDQLATVAADIDAIPVDARIPVEQADEAARQAKTAATAADMARDVAHRAFIDQERLHREFDKLTGDITAAELAARRHERLDKLLGKTGLQLELVRSAERDIVHLANATAQNLSDGDLSIELDVDAGDSEAFALRVRRADDPTPIGVQFLSGSQKFRVAVAVALAIGRYAAGQARPLESVIIDEGFGSLDKDGLRAMADELNQLQRTQSLKRIVLVSHQEEFYRQFRVGYHLTPGENGTTATPFRQ